MIAHILVVCLPILHYFRARHKIYFTRHKLGIIHTAYGIINGTVFYYTLIQIVVLQGLPAEFRIHQTFKIIQMPGHTDMTRHRPLEFLTQKKRFFQKSAYR